MKLQNILLYLVAIISAFLLISCDRVVVNSAENDELIASVADLPGGANFKAVVPYIISKCANCHTHAGWYSFGEADYLAAGLIDLSGYQNSKMYYRLSTATEGPGPRNMPQGGSSAFTEEEIELLKAWIAGYGI